MIEGSVYNRLTVIKATDRKTGNKTIYECRCSCGNTVFTDKYKLFNGHTKSCGCFKLENLSVIKRKHGMTKTPEHKAWVEMRQRCYNKNNRVFSYYGGRGITVCEAWLNSFESFYSDMNKRPTSKHSIDRIDVNGNYEPRNCRWATPNEQAANRRDTTKYIFNNELMPLSYIANALGLPQQTMHRLVRKKGMTIEQVITSRL